MILRCAVFILQQALRLPLEVTLVGTSLDGLSGTDTIMLSTCFAYISDTVSLERRSYRIMVMVIASRFLDGSFQLAMGYMITGLGYLWPFVFLLVLHTLNLVYILFFVPESRVPSDDKAGFSPYLIIESFKVNFNTDFIIDIIQDTLDELCNKKREYNSTSPSR